MTDAKGLTMGDWWCPKCEAFLCWQQVTHTEHHEACGCPVVWKNADGSDAETLMDEAITIHAETGLTPREMMRERDRLIEAGKVLAGATQELLNHGSPVQVGEDMETGEPIAEPFQANSDNAVQALKAWASALSHEKKESGK